MNVLLWLLILISSGILGWCVLEPRRLYRFSFFFVASFIGFAMPQIIGLSNESGTLFAGKIPEGAIDMLTLVAILCVIAAFLGDLRANTHPSRAPIVPLTEYDYNRLVRVCFGLTLGSIVIMQIGSLYITEEDIARMGNQYTGLVTILIFFAQMQKYGFALAVFLYFKLRSPLAAMCAVTGILMNGYLFFVGFRRASAADLIFITLLGIYFARRFVVPAWALGAMFAFGALWSNSIGAFRGQEELTIIQKFQNVDIVDEFANTLNNGGFELHNAALWIWCADFEGDYDFGKIHWNQLVHGYFPGQIFGADVKLALKFEERNLPLERLNYKGPLGATTTGLADAFCSFWYFGCIKFYIIGYVMGRWWNRGNRGDLRSQLAYMSLMGVALHTISHGTFWLLNGYLHMVIFAYPCLWWARLPARSHSSTEFVRPSPAVRTESAFAS